MSFADVPTHKLLSVSWIGFAAILVMPFRIGEFVRPYMIRSPGRTDAKGKTVNAITMSADATKCMARQPAAHGSCEVWRGKAAAPALTT